MRCFTLALACLGGVCAFAYAQRCWGTGSGSPVGDTASRVHVYEWKVLNVSQHGLYRNGIMVGGFDHEAEHYLPYARGVWGSATAPPVSPPPPPAGFSAYLGARRKEGKADALPTGVILEKLSPVERYTIGGKEVSKERVYDAVGDEVGGPEALRDDSKKPIVSVIGDDDAERKTLAAKIKAAGAGAYKVWEGPANDWSFEPGFKRDGKPVTLYAQTADGVVKHRQDDLDGGVEKALEAIRKANPDYDPAKDPDLRKPQPSPAVDGKVQVPGAYLAAGAAAAAAVVALSRKPKA